MLDALNNIVNLRELLTRAVKYIFEGIMVAIAAYAIPAKALKLDEVCLIALTAAATFSILDSFLPSIGANLVGFPR